MSGLSPTALTTLLTFLTLTSLGLGAWIFVLLRQRRQHTPALEPLPAPPVAGPSQGHHKPRSADIDLEVLLAASFDAVFFTDREGRIIQANAVAASLVGLDASRLGHRRLTDFFDPECVEMPFRRFSEIFGELGRRGMAAALEGFCIWQPSPSAVARHFEVAGGPLYDLAETGGLRGYLVVCHDVTEKRRVDAEQDRAQRLESLALLAGGIAHDFNNLLTILLGNLSLLRAEAELPAHFVEPLSDAEKAVLRARGLADQLLTFSSGSALSTRAHNLADLLRDSASFVFRGAKARCELHLADDLRAVEIDPQQIHQVLNNLLINARQAMPDGGVVEIHAENMRVGVGQNRLRPGSYVRVRIRDSGPGIEPGVLPKIFDPYFTTKKDGTGLGLSTSNSIIKRHRGTIEVDSRPGEGTTFTVMLPTARGQVETQTISLPRPTKGRGRVLVMDDENSIVNILSAALKRLGFDSVACADGKAAIEARAAAAAEGKPFDLAILDLTIPGGMGGVEAAAALRKEQPSILLVASSGYAQNPVLVQFRDYGFDQILVKPYRIQDLAQLLSALLPADGEAGSTKDTHD